MTPLSHHCIDKPVTTLIMNMTLCLLGLVGLFHLTVREYPQIAAVEFNVTVFYPNASPESVESDVVVPLEDTLAGIEGLLSIQSRSRQGNALIELTFSRDVSSSVALNRIREQLFQVRSQLPKDIEEPTITASDDHQRVLMYVVLQDDTRSGADLMHLVHQHVKNRLRTIPGVATLQINGPSHQLVIQLNRTQMHAHHISPDHLIDVLKNHHVVLPAGRWHDQIPISMDLAAHSVEAFERMVVKHEHHAVVYLRDIATVKIQSDERGLVRVNGQSAVSIGIIPTNDANALALSQQVQNLIPQLNSLLPEHTRVFIHSDKADFIRVSLTNMCQSLFEAMLLVAMVLFWFLKNIRLALIPILTIPISILGAFFCLYVFQGSINVITLLSLVLATGLVVDDAIVVLENIQQKKDQGQSTKVAAKTGSHEITPAVIAMTSTLVCVYIPLMFINSDIGTIFKEFALMLSATLILSAVVALTLSPMLAARTGSQTRPDSERRHRIYPLYLSWLLPRHGLAWVASVLLLGSSVGLYWMLPHDLAPVEDRGLMGVYVPSIAGQSVSFFDQYIQQAEQKLHDIPEKRHILTMVGRWGANLIMPLKPWHERDRTPIMIRDELRRTLVLPSVDPYPWSWNNALPGISGSVMSDVSVMLKTHQSFAALYLEANRLVALLKEKLPSLIDGYQDLKLSHPSLQAVVDPEQLMAWQIKPEKIANVLSIMFHDKHVAYFRKDGIPYRVVLSHDETLQHLEEVYLTNDQGHRLSLDTLVHFKKTASPGDLPHYNQMRAATIQLSFDRHVDFAQALQQVDTVLQQHLSDDFSYEYSQETQRYLESKQGMWLLFLLGLFFVYAILAVQFESFIDPLLIIYTVPLACFGGLMALWLGQEGIHIYSQIGFITLVGLVTKHGVLIIDYTNQARRAGSDVMEAVQQACLRRLRPIAMTAITMVLGVLPLILSTGAGAEARRSIGWVLLGGMSLGTVLILGLFPAMVYTMKGGWTTEHHSG